MEANPIDLTVLTDDQKRHLYASLAADYGRPGAKFSQPLTEDQALIWDTINDVLKRNRHLHEVLPDCGRGYSMARYADDVEIIMGWIAEGSSTRLTKVQRMALVRCGFECLIRRLKAQGTPVIHKTLLQQLPKLTAVMETAFPGYADAHVLDRVITPSETL